MKDILVWRSLPVSGWRPAAAARSSDDLDLGMPRIRQLDFKKEIWTLSQFRKKKEKSLVQSGACLACQFVSFTDQKI
jgi:hypothetical protein